MFSYDGFDVNFADFLKIIHMAKMCGSQDWSENETEGLIQKSFSLGFHILYITNCQT